MIKAFCKHESTRKLGIKRLRFYAYTDGMIFAKNIRERERERERERAIAVFRYLILVFYRSCCASRFENALQNSAGESNICIEKARSTARQVQCTVEKSSETHPNTNGTKTDNIQLIVFRSGLVPRRSVHFAGHCSIVVVIGMLELFVKKINGEACHKTEQNQNYYSTEKPTAVKWRQIYF